MREITILSDGSTVFYDTNWDNWRVKYKNGSFETSYKDRTMFIEFNNIASYTSNITVYNDLLSIHNATQKVFNRAIIDMIKQIAQKYPNTIRNKVERFYTLFYYMMVSEENKAYSVTGKKIKMHGVYHLLINQHIPEDAANIAYGYKGRAKELLEECRQMGF
ncbi:hypothetical protein M3638_10310 [Oceanobacillus profundus]|uniref:DUF7004 family protein n=1 Tax=Oceanobacillus profundus TaxID=372463 RepID=UPI00203BD7AC|nr:hypothetical protein [Oceanobacillus profundus]MCM3398216.1 hypothetical protein [Oceanobacillus profundus]